MDACLHASHVVPVRLTTNLLHTAGHRVLCENHIGFSCHRVSLESGLREVSMIWYLVYSLTQLVQTQQNGRPLRIMLWNATGRLIAESGIPITVAECAQSTFGNCIDHMLTASTQSPVFARVASVLFLPELLFSREFQHIGSWLQAMSVRTSPSIQAGQILKVFGLIKATRIQSISLHLHAPSPSPSLDRWPPDRRDSRFLMLMHHKAWGISAR
jgi:hypothetical protein